MQPPQPLLGKVGHRLGLALQIIPPASVSLLTPHVFASRAEGAMESSGFSQEADLRTAPSIGHPWKSAGRLGRCGRPNAAHRQLWDSSAVVGFICLSRSIRVSVI
jgi:hypothetical protein